MRAFSDIADFSLSIDKQNGRQFLFRSQLIHNRTIAHRHRILDTVFVDELPNDFQRLAGIVRVVHRDTNNVNVVAAVFLVEFHEVRDGFTAWLAPGCPQVKNQDSAAVIGVTNATRIDIGDVEFKVERTEFGN